MNYLIKPSLEVKMKRRQLIILNIIFIIVALSVKGNGIPDPDPQRFQKEIEVFIQWDKKNTVPSNSVLFVGSSSIRLWKTKESFPELPVINRGFGGSHISDVNYYFDQIVKKYQPRVIVLYAGDNDIAAQKSPQQVCDDFIEFVEQVKTKLSGTPIIYLPIKPSTNRWQFWTAMKEANLLIKEYIDLDNNLYYSDTATSMIGKNGQPRSELFLTDGLHLNEKGYQLWVTILNPLIERIYKGLDH